MPDKIINTSFFDENSVGHNASDALDKIRRWYTLLSKNALIADCGENFTVFMLCIQTKIAEICNCFY